jgi:flagellin-like hook-associated protein FlgL
MAPSGQYLNSSNSLADWQAATSAYDAVNGTDISAELPDEILTAIDSGNANAELSATAAILGENTNRLLSASDSLEDWKAAIEAFDAAQGTSTELSAVFTHPIASETDTLNSVTKQEEVPYQAGTEEVTIESNDTIKVNFGDLTADMAAVSDTNVQSQEDAQAVLVILDEGITTISKRRAAFGAAANRLEYAIDNLTNIQNNAEASRSRIMDTDYAETTSELAKAQIIAQAGTAMLAQANQLPQNILTLLK